MKNTVDIALDAVMIEPVRIFLCFSAYLRRVVVYRVYRRNRQKLQKLD